MIYNNNSNNNSPALTTAREQLRTYSLEIRALTGCLGVVVALMICISTTVNLVVFESSSNYAHSEKRDRFSSLFRVVLALLVGIVCLT